MDPWRNAFSELADAVQMLVSADDGSENDSFSDLIRNGNYGRLKAGDLPAGTQAKIKNIRGTRTLVFDPEKIPEAALFEAREEFETAYVQANGFSIDANEGIATAIKTEGTGGTLDEIYSYYQGKVPRRYLPILKESLTLRIAERENDYSRYEINEWKYQIAEGHKNRGHDLSEAYALSSLCSAGYLDQNRIFRDIYEEKVTQGTWTNSDYREMFSTYVSEKPFVVFVKADGDDYKGVYHNTLGKIQEASNYNPEPEFIDIRGKGEETRDIIKKTMGYFSKHHDNIIYDNADENDQYVVRLDPNSI